MMTDLFASSADSLSKRCTLVLVLARSSLLLLGLFDLRIPPLPEARRQLELHGVAHAHYLVQFYCVAHLCDSQTFLHFFEQIALAPV